MIQEFVTAHPFLTTLMWAIVSAALNSIFNYVPTDGRLKALHDLLKATGLDPVSATKALQKLVMGQEGPSPSGSTGKPVDQQKALPEEVNDKR